MSSIKSVMIGSTVQDLPEHRRLVQDACWRQKMFPLMMEHLPARDEGAVATSLKMVEEADLYLGIFGRRYGYVPVGLDNSIVEMEYRHAVRTGKPRLIFLMHEDHPAGEPAPESEERARRLAALRQELMHERVVNFFRSAAELHALVINSLAHHRAADLTALHPGGVVPLAPEPYVAHPYTLLQTRGVVGRLAELALLDDWMGDGARVGQARMLALVSIGGMGKSALAWHWFRQRAPLAAIRAAGRIWWSFYESDATFENLVARALSYATRRPLQEVERLPWGERAAWLLRELDGKPFLLVLDGLERVLVGYTDPAAPGPAEETDQAASRRLRRTADPRAGALLRQLATVQTSRILVSTRVLPVELENATAQPLPGVFVHELAGLSDEDALELWHALGVGGSRRELLPLFNSFGNHALLLQVLASEVAHDRRAPGDFARWRESHPDFDPFGMPLKQTRAHVLEVALRGLDEAKRSLLHTIAAFRIPVTFDTLTALQVGEGRRFADDAALVEALAELEDRGLLGWDRRANRYDLHPIVRGVVWSGVREESRSAILSSLATHFESIPTRTERFSSWEEMTPLVELYGILIDLGRHDDAYRIFLDRLDEPTLRLGIYPQRVDLLERLFPRGTEEPPALSSPASQAGAIFGLATSHDLNGQPGQAVPLHQRAYMLYRRLGRHGPPGRALRGAVFVMFNAADTLRLCGRLVEAESGARWAAAVAESHGDAASQVVALAHEGGVLAARGALEQARTLLEKGLKTAETHRLEDGEAVVCVYYAQMELWAGKVRSARKLAARCREAFGRVAEATERDRIRAERLRHVVELGGALFRRGLKAAGEGLQQVLARARTVKLTEEEIPAAIGLAEVRRRQGDCAAARDLLAEVLYLCDRGPYPLFEADALNLLAQIEREAGGVGAAVEAAAKAYRRSWCDGPPYSYRWGMDQARRHLAALHAREPADLPPFDASRYVPLATRPELAPLARRP